MHSLNILFFLLFAQTLVAGPCPPRTPLRTQIKRLSEVDGSEIIHIQDFIKKLEASPRWKPLAQQIRESRELYAERLKERRAEFQLSKQGKPPRSGYGRMKEWATSQEGKSLDEAFSKFNPGQEIQLTHDSAKIIISPKNKVQGQDYIEILYDFSGNYFRLQKGRFVGEKELQFLSDNDRYLDWAGNLLHTDDVSRGEMKRLMGISHWNALP